ncbi:MAG: NAD(P)/FAD-dependent oxidoreductase [Deltaproteobacteria bacterium]|nr:NAD(P)/FAD-dependent oxidoreductase [Deltaproteobacteria bacterium]
MTQKTTPEKVVIIGAGPAGLTASYILTQKGISNSLLEKDTVVGGISRTVHYKGFHFDIGGHRFFTKVKPVEAIWHEVLRNDFLLRPRLSRIYYKQKFFYYPLKPVNALLGLGFFNSFLIFLSYLKIRIKPLEKEENLEQWVINRFGKRLYKTFFKTYTEKVWGIPCTEIRAEWAAQRIRGLSLRSALWNAIVKPRGKKIKTLIDEFHYPKKGPGQLWEKVAEKIGEKNNIYFERDVVRIERDGFKILSIKTKTPTGEKTVYAGSHFISSMPLRHLLENMKPKIPDEILQAAQCLKYRDFLTVALIIKKRDIFPDNWIYIHDPSVQVGRIQNFKNWSPFMVPDPEYTCLGLEYFCFEKDGLWNKSDEALIRQGAKELEQIGIVRAEEVIDGSVVRMPKAYPVYDSGYQNHIKTIQDFVDRFENLYPVGRNGMHKYNNQDHAMYTAILAVENMFGAKHNLWEVNTDMEYHEEQKLS